MAWNIPQQRIKSTSTILEWCSCTYFENMVVKSNVDQPLTSQRFSSTLPGAQHHVSQFLDQRQLVFPLGTLGIHGETSMLLFIDEKGSDR